MLSQLPALLVCDIMERCVQVQHLEQKVVAQQRMVDAQQLDLCSQQQEFMARIRDLEMKLTSMEHSLVAAPGTSSLTQTPVRKVRCLATEQDACICECPHPTPESSLASCMSCRHHQSGRRCLQLSPPSTGPGLCR